MEISEHVAHENQNQHQTHESESDNESESSYCKCSLFYLLYRSSRMVTQTK